MNVYINETIILLLISLDKLGLLKTNSLMGVNIENFTLENFHIFYNLFFKIKERYFSNYESDILNKMFTDFLNNSYKLDNVIKMRETINYIFRTTYNNITFQNILVMTQKNYSSDINLFMKKLFDDLKDTNNQTQIFFIAYIFTSYSSEPKETFGKIINVKEIKPNDIDEEILSIFLHSVENRLRYSYLYDYEIYLLKRIK
jgi:hypothetical protein